jgi:hypothetical protein
MLEILFLLQLKHLVIDWILQPAWMWQNKGTYGHLGGVSHAGVNALGTAACIGFFNPSIFLTVLVLDFLAHYHIDWAKMNINRLTGWGPTTHPQFWWLTGFDQFLHQVTYLGLLMLL